MRIQKAFTLIEIVLAIVILGLLVAMALPNYLTLVNRSYAKNAMHNLLSIQAAQLRYKQNISGNSYCTSSCNDLSSLNTSLDLNITPANGATGWTYDCNQAGSTCQATKTGIFKLLLDLTKPIKTTAPVFCTANVPNDWYNPCCDKTYGGGGGTGKPCP